MGKHSKRGRTAARAAAAASSLAALAVATPAVAATVPGIDWAPIIACESGGNPTIVNASGHGGLLQFSAATWLRYGGGQYAARAELATPAQQLAVAEVAYAANGLSDWLASQGCWSGKVTLSAPVVAPPRPPAPAAPAAKHASGLPAAAPASTTGPRHGQRYTIRSGDTLSGIAAVVPQGGSWQQLYAANRDVVGTNPDLIFPGEVLQV